MEFLDLILMDWLSLAIRWLHIITGIAWIGSSFYFIATDLNLRHRPHLPQGASGETWQVHGGGFYHIQKYMVAPDNLPEHLTWFKWEAYFTWMSGFALLCVVYYTGAEVYLIDRSVMDLSEMQAIAIGIAGLAAGWLLYDLLCRMLEDNDQLLFVILFAFVIALSWGFTQVFSGRGAYVHAGAVIAGIMSGNVFFLIIPNQKKVVAAMLAGEVPAAIYGKQAKQRSTHNNYLTLPVLFLMLSIHYPLAFASRWNWLIVALVLVIGVVIRHFFNSEHAGKGKQWWTWGVAAICFAGIIWLSTFPPLERPEPEEAMNNTAPAAVIETAQFEAVRDIIGGRCSMCHAREPVWEGILKAPKGVHLETDSDILQYANRIYLHAARTDAMPPGNVTWITGEERGQLANWYRTYVR